jgi:hypothetical protein
MARKTDRYTVTSSNVGLSFQLPDGKQFDFNIAELSEDKKHELLILGMQTAITRRVVDSDSLATDLPFAWALVKTGARKERETSQASPLYVKAYQLFRRFAALNTNNPDPQITEDQAADALEALSEEDFKKLKGNNIFNISYKKAKQDQQESALAAQMKALGL